MTNVGCAGGRERHSVPRRAPHSYWALLVGILSLLTAGCGIGYETHSFRYRMTVEVDTPAGPRSGSSVIELRVTETPFWDMGRAANFDLRGEAVAIDLPDGQTLFALLASPGDAEHARHVVLRSFRSPATARALQQGKGLDWGDEVNEWRRTQPSAELIGDQRPTMVVFRDITDPRTVEAVGVLNAPGIRVRRVSIAVTEDPITEGIRHRLLWLEDHRGSLLYDGRLHPQAREKDLTPRAFRQGDVY